VCRLASGVETRYPSLFRETDWGPVHAVFSLLETLPPAELISNINLLPYISDRWVSIQLEDGSWEVPGGTLEPGEDLLAAAQRELAEEAGARLVSLQPFGAWRCWPSANLPYRPHLPHPEFYRVAALAAVEQIADPGNPPGGEQVIAVSSASFTDTAGRFEQTGRPELADLYRLAAEFLANGRLRRFLPAPMKTCPEVWLLPGR
jgi:8-oxo-dGTP diphosphatase